MMRLTAPVSFAGYWRDTVGTKEKSTPSEDLRAIHQWLYTDMRSPAYQRQPKPTWLAVANRSVQLANRVLARLESQARAPEAFQFFVTFKTLAEQMQSRLRQAKHPGLESSLPDFHAQLHRPLAQQLNELDKIQPILDLEGHPEAFEQVFRRELLKKP